MLKIINAGHYARTMLATALAMTTGALAPLALTPSKGATPNKYNTRRPDRIQDDVIASHNAQVAAQHKAPTISKGKRKKIAAAQRKAANLIANGA